MVSLAATTGGSSGSAMTMVLSGVVSLGSASAGATRGSWFAVRFAIDARGLPTSSRVTTGASFTSGRDSGVSAGTSGSVVALPVSTTSSDGDASGVSSGVSESVSGFEGGSCSVGSSLATSPSSMATGGSADSSGFGLDSSAVKNCFSSMLACSLATPPSGCFAALKLNSRSFLTARSGRLRPGKAVMPWFQRAGG